MIDKLNNWFGFLTIAAFIQSKVPGLKKLRPQKEQKILEMKNHYKHGVLIKIRYGIDTKRYHMDTIWYGIVTAWYGIVTIRYDIGTIWYGIFAR